PAGRGGGRRRHGDLAGAARSRPALFDGAADPPLSRPRTRNPELGARSARALGGRRAPRETRPLGLARRTARPQRRPPARRRRIVAALGSGRGAGAGPRRPGTVLRSRQGPEVSTRASRSGVVSPVAPFARRVLLPGPSRRAGNEDLLVGEGTRDRGRRD